MKPSETLIMLGCFLVCMLAVLCASVRGLEDRDTLLHGTYECGNCGIGDEQATSVKVNFCMQAGKARLPEKRSFQMALSAGLKY